MVARGILAAVSLLVASNASAQTYTTYTDRALFLAALTNTRVQTFDSFVADQSLVNNTPVAVGDFSITRSGGGTTIIDASPFAANNVNGTTDLLVAGGNGTSNAFTFSNGTKAFGADFYGFNDATQRSTLVINGVTYTPPIGTSTSNTFFGIISTGTFNTVSIAQTVSDGFALDNVTYQLSSAAPEPSAWALLIVGFVIVGYAMRRRPVVYGRSATVV